MIHRQEQIVTKGSSTNRFVAYFVEDSSFTSALLKRNHLRMIDPLIFFSRIDSSVWTSVFVAAFSTVIYCKITG